MLKKGDFASIANANRVTLFPSTAEFTPTTTSYTSTFRARDRELQRAHQSHLPAQVRGAARHGPRRPTT
ncbi:hypothetical protein F2981_31615 (plasmid) [Sinorhizobium meliloti]|nr:hypothetical protein [Sinorhizobium meliloti]